MKAWESVEEEKSGGLLGAPPSAKLPGEGHVSDSSGSETPKEEWIKQKRPTRGAWDTIGGLDLNPMTMVDTLVDAGKDPKPWSTARCMPRDVAGASQYLDRVLSHSNDMRRERLKLTRKIGLDLTPIDVFETGKNVHRVANRIRETNKLYDPVNHILSDSLPKKTIKVLRMSLSKDARQRMDAHEAEVRAKRKADKASAKRSAESKKRSTSRKKGKATAAARGFASLSISGKTLGGRKKKMPKSKAILTRRLKAMRKERIKNAKLRKQAKFPAPKFVVSRRAAKNPGVTITSRVDDPTKLAVSSRV